MRYRLPLELELMILDLAAPPLAYASLHERVAFFINVSLVHRSLTAWAQERLHDQFLYTYRPRDNGFAPLKTRLEAGLGRERPLRRLYLDLTGLTWFMCWQLESATHSDTPPVAGYWQLRTMITKYCQTLDTLWLKLPLYTLDIKYLPPPRVLYIDDGFVGEPRNCFRAVSLSSETTVFLHCGSFYANAGDGNLETRTLVIDRCWTAETPISDLLLPFHRLETLVVIDTGEDELVSMIVALPSIIRHVHVLEREFDIDDDRPDVPNVLPHLESFTFTWLLPSTENGPRALADDDPDALVELQRTVESAVIAPKCTFKYLRSTKSPDDALADAVADFKL